MSRNHQPTEPDQHQWNGHHRSHPNAKHELWTITFAFFAHDEGHARATAQHATRRLAKVLPWFDKDAVAMARESDPYNIVPVYCDNDIYCVLKPFHDGPCRAQNGADLDQLDLEHGDAPAFGADL